MSNRRGKLNHVELLNVPCYGQGAFDSLCAYYTGAMMLSTLFPEYNTRFGKAARQRTTKHVSDDPLVKHHPTTATIGTRWLGGSIWVSTSKRSPKP